MSNVSTVFAFEDVVAQMADGSPRIIRVKALPVRKHLEFLGKRIDEIGMLEMVCVAPVGAEPLPEEWVDSLSTESHIALVKKANELNFRKATETLDRHVAVAEETKPLNEKVKVFQA